MKGRHTLDFIITVLSSDNSQKVILGCFWYQLNCTMVLSLMKDKAHLVSFLKRLQLQNFHLIILKLLF